MHKTVSIVILLSTCLASPARSAMVSQRWGVAGHVQHPGTLRYEPLGRQQSLIRIDLAALPQGVKVYRARLFFSRPGLYGSKFDVVPLDEPPQAAKTEKAPTGGKALALAPPYFRWFDATEAVRQWAAAGRAEGVLLVRSAPDFDRDATLLEIAYEGELPSPPRQVTGLAAFCRGGQVFITFREIEDFAGRREDITWAELAGRLTDIDQDGPIPKDEPHEVRYRVYAHDRPITPQTIGQAVLLAEVVPGSMYNTRLVPGGDFVKMRPEAVALRLAVEPGRPLPPGSGLYVHTVGRDAAGCFAVTTAVDGVENTVHFSAENATGPIALRRGRPEPVLQAVPKAHGHQNAGLTELRDGQVYHEDWYSYWAVPPESPRPTRYDFAVGYCPQTMARPAPLTFTRGHTWNPNPEMPSPEAGPGIVMSMGTDSANGFWTGTNDARGTLKGIEEGRWQPSTHNRQEALIRWAQQEFEIDQQRIVAAVGAWGMWEFRRPDLYAYIHGWGMPEVTRGFQCWNWARAAWGPPEAYAGKPDDENPFHLQDYTRFALEDPNRELPYFYIHTGWGAHFSEMGWPPFPRFVRALIDTRRAFVMQPGGGPVGRALSDRTIDIRRDQSLPAFGNCSLDDNLGSGEIGTGMAFGQVNGYLLWDTRTIVDEPGRWAVTVWLDDSAPLDRCTVDLTPRRCQRLVVQPGQRLAWSSTVEGQQQPAAKGWVEADRFGLATIEQMPVGKQRHRILIERR